MCVKRVWVWVLFLVFIGFWLWNFLRGLGNIILCVSVELIKKLWEEWY